MMKYSFYIYFASANVKIYKETLRIRVFGYLCQSEKKTCKLRTSNTSVSLYL